MSEAQRKITAADILSNGDYQAQRKAYREKLLAVKKLRRLEVGPFITFYFENYATMWLQVQEMLRIEKGGEEQLEGELNAYNPLIPQGNDLIATMMLEIEEGSRRNQLLAKLGGIENCVFLQIGGDVIDAAPATHEDRTTADGKTSSVHWVRFVFNAEQVERFKGAGRRLVLGINHPNYAHMAVVGETTRAALAKDFD